jgi:hypothetical protein
MASKFGELIQQKTNAVYDKMTAMTGSNMTASQSAEITASVNELGIVTQQLMNAQKTYKGVFDKINRTVD